jgi:hypothetical protein
MRPRRRSAFGTWIRVAFVLGCLLLVVWSMFEPTYGNGGEEARAYSAQTGVQSIADCVRLFWLKHHRMPTWTDLVTPDARGRPYLEEVRDPWDHAYVLEPGADDRTLLVRCLGRDGVANTGDDVVATVRGPTVIAPRIR